MINIETSQMPEFKFPKTWAGYSAIVNVSDSPGLMFESIIGSRMYWFPIMETGWWGYSPFYGAAKVVDVIESTRPILVHCHGGVNRSVSVAVALLLAEGWTREQVNAKWPQFQDAVSVFERNIEQGHIPSDIIHFLQIRKMHPKYAISGLLNEIKSPNMFYSNASHDLRKILSKPPKFKIGFEYSDNCMKDTVAPPPPLDIADKMFPPKERQERSLLVFRSCQVDFLVLIADVAGKYCDKHNLRNPCFRSAQDGWLELVVFVKK